MLHASRQVSRRLSSSEPIPDLEFKSCIYDGYDPPNQRREQLAPAFFVPRKLGSHL